jgi:threonine/homoserine/homoserine lactone efflux protein
MDLLVFARGLLIGFSIAAPVGPIGVLCIRRTLADGRLIGLATGMGAATADGIYGAIAGFGVSAVTRVMVHEQIWIRVLGGCFLCYLGVKTLRAAPATEAASSRGRRFGAYASAVGLTLTNPATILSFAAIFAGLGAGSAVKTTAATALMVLGVFLGSTLWWVVLTTALSLARERVSARALQLVNRVSGAILAGFGLVALLSAL